MEDKTLFFSFLFFITFTVELFFGITIIHLNPKGKLNRQFFIISIALCFWSFGFAMSNSAENMEICLFWRRFSALGWTVVYSMLLHMILILSGKNKVLKKKHYLLLYLPAAINLYVFSISESISRGQYNLVMGTYGWFNITVNNGWDWFFYIHYLGYILAGVVILLNWKHTSDDHIVKKQANIILWSIVCITILGTLTDIILDSILKGSIPQIAPIFNLIPVLSLIYSIKNNSFMKETTQDKNELILTSTTRIKLYFYLAILFLVGGTISSSSYFIPNLILIRKGVESTIYASVILYIIGILIMLFQFISKENIRDFLVLSVILLSIPITTFIFIENAAITVWVFPLILIIVSLVFNTKVPLTLVTIVGIITQIFVWTHVPTDTVYIDKWDYILRIGIFVVAYGIGTIINKIYINRLKENIDKVKSQKLLSAVSFEFVSANKINIDEKINNTLEEIGEFFEIDRAYIFTINQQNSTMTYSYEWCAEGIVAEVETIEEVPLDVFPWWMERLRNDGWVFIEDVSKLPNEASSEKEQLTRQNIKSVMVVPIESSTGITGFVGLDSVRDFKSWADDDIDLLKILANILSDGLIKIKSENEIEYMAYYDHLTGLANRTLFTDRLRQAIEVAKRNEKFVAVIFMDLDSFKMINDTMGHSRGDEILKRVAQNLTNILRKTDTAARFGGDEFLIMLDNIENEKNISDIANKIMDTFKRPFIIDEHEFFITGSAGIAVYPRDGEDGETLVKNADIAMYRAKANGKNKYVMCTENMKEEVKKNMTISNHLFRARERGELMVYYQPQINLQTGKIIGLESLLRWNHPTFGMIPPNVFIPLAEKNGSINSIGEWVLRTACNQNKAWQDMGLLYARIAVNLSVIQFNDPLIVEKVDKILKETGLSPKHLELEITESIAVKENKNVVDILDRLKKLGVSISIDDFGTEYSSLSRLKTLPIDRIKIDMQFIHGIEGNEKDQAITKIIINLANSLNLEVIAEGVETKGQMEFLNQKMCDEAQGYYYYKPMPAEELEEILINKIIKL